MDKDIDIEEKRKGTGTGTGTLIAGTGVGTFGIVHFLTSGLVCPACLVVTPILLGVGVVQKIRARNKEIFGKYKK